jgi:uncharacterized alkaline shock family protein YloU
MTLLASSTTLVKGVSNTITIRAGYSNTEATVWIDYNHNNVFDGATEQVGQIDCVNEGTDYSATFTVPAGALTGNTRLRIMTEDEAFPDDPCSTSMYFGNCCDFGINITAAGSPVVTTLAATGITKSSATLNGTVNAAGLSCTVAFDYGLTVAYGTTVPGTPSPVTGNVDTPVSSAITGLQPNTLYHYRVKCSRTGGTVFGSDMTFTTASLSPPAITTLAATGITQTSATINGTVNGNNESTAVTFDFGLTVAYGSTVPGVPSPVTGNLDNPVTASITGLSPCTLYHYHCVGASSEGTSRGDDMTFQTSASGTSITISGPANACAGSSGNQYSTHPGMTNYSWTVSPGGTITAGGTSTSNTVTVTWNTAGPQSVSVSYPTALGCSAGSPTEYDVIVNPRPPDPEITGRKVACRNIPGNVYTTATGMNNYSWTVSGGGVITDGAGTNSIKVTWDSAGSKNIMVTYTGDNGCSPEEPGEIHVMVIEYLCGCDNLK